MALSISNFEGIMVEPYITFYRQTSAAIDFYEPVFEGTNKRVMPFGDVPPNPNFTLDEDKKDWILHGEIVLHKTNFSISDHPDERTHCNFISLMIRCYSDEEVQKLFEELAAGGHSGTCLNILCFDVCKPRRQVWRYLGASCSKTIAAVVLLSAAQPR